MARCIHDLCEDCKWHGIDCDENEFYVDVEDDGHDVSCKHYEE